MKISEIKPIRNAKRKRLFDAIVKEIKKSRRELQEGQFFATVPLSYSRKMANTFTWKCDEIKVGDTKFVYSESKLPEEDFTTLVRDAARRTGYACDFRTKKVPDGNGYYDALEYLNVLAHSCHDFRVLQSIIMRHTGEKLKDASVRYSKIIGKNESYTAKETKYLCHDEELCASIKQWLRNRNPADTLRISFESSITIDPKYMRKYHEGRRWHGEDKSVLILEIINMFGRKHKLKEFCPM